MNSARGMMDRKEFLDFVSQVKWFYAKSVPNWPHFYIVEKDLADQVAFQAARSFVKESGYVGKFYDMDVTYFDADGWTYWASPLAKPPESQYMLNKCKTEYSYESLAKSGSLPPEGFRESKLSLDPILKDTEFISLAREFVVFDVLGTSEYEIRHSNVLFWLLNQNGNHRQGSAFLGLLWQCIGGEPSLPNLSFREYSVSREGENEDESIDILIKAKNGDWVIVVENKLFSPVTRDQLGRYFRYIEHRYREVPHRLYFYLTPEGKEPSKKEDRQNWKPISYSAVVQAVQKFLERSLHDRVRSFLEQYVEHIEKSVLGDEPRIKKQQRILERHAKTFDSLAHLLEEEYIRSQCSELQFDLLKSTIAVQKAVGRELWKFTKQMIKQHGYTQHSGLGDWVTIKLPGLQERLALSGLAKPGEVPILFCFDSRPASYVVEVWIYKKMSLFPKVKGRLQRFSEDRPEPNRGDEHLVEVLRRKTVINTDEIVRQSLQQLKERIAAFFDSELKGTLERWAAEIGDGVDSIGRNGPH